MAFLDVTTNKNKKKNKKTKAKNKAGAPLPRDLQQHPLPFDSEKDEKVDFEHESSSSGDDDEDSLTNTNNRGNVKSVFTQLAERQKKHDKRSNKQQSGRDSSVEGSIRSDATGGGWNMVRPQQQTTSASSSSLSKLNNSTLIKEGSKMASSTNSAANSVLFETEDSRDISDNESMNDDGEQELLLKQQKQQQSSSSLKKRGRKSPSSKKRQVTSSDAEEDEMLRQYKKSSNTTSIPNLLEILKSLLKFMKTLDWRVVIFVLVTFGILCALKLGEESYVESRRGGDVIEADLYEVLHVPKSATKRDVERAYRRMSVEWHPDRNPDCPQCMKKFQEISHAYSVLSNKESREMYDKSSSSFTAIDSSAITLTSHNYDEIITDSLNHKVWVIQVYTDLDPLCRHVAPAWEDAVLRLGRSVGFARINARTTKELLSRLPVKVRIFPTIIMLSEGGKITEIYGNVYQMTAGNFRTWITRHYPSAYKRLYDANGIESFLTTSTSDIRPHLIVTSPQPLLPLAIRSQLYLHGDVYQSAHTLIHEAKSSAQSWNLSQPDREINVIRFSPAVQEDQSTSSPPKPLRVYSLPYNATDEDVVTVFRKLRRMVPARLTFPTSPVLCGNENDSPGSLCLLRVLDNELPPGALQFTTPLRSSDDDDSEDDDDDENKEQKEKAANNSGGKFSFFTEASDRVSTAAQVLMHGAKKVCRFEDSDFWGHKGIRRHMKKTDDDDVESFDVEKYLQLTYMIRPPPLPRWISQVLSWSRPLSMHYSFFACHDIWGSILKESDLLIFQRSSGRLLPLQRVETSLTSAVEIASDIFNGFVDIDVSSQLRSLGAPQSKDWRGIDSKERHSVWDARLLSCGTPVTITSTMKALFNYLFSSKLITSIFVICFGSFLWWAIATSIEFIRERRDTHITQSGSTF